MPNIIFCKYCSKKIEDNKKIIECNYHFCDTCINYCLTDIVFDLIPKYSKVISICA